MAMAAILNGHLHCDQTFNKNSAYKINNIPCAQPIYKTGSLIFARYLNGMAINNRTRKDVPSASAISLNLPKAEVKNEFLCIFRHLSS